MNSTVHGLRAFTVVLPNESEEEIQQLMDDWTTHYRATSPGRRELVDRAVTATLHHQRSKRYLAATLREQVRGAERAFDEEQDNIVQHYVELLPVDPSASIRGLRRTAAGCRWVLREWFGLETHVINGGAWTPSIRRHATRLLGHKPDDRTDEVSYRMLYMAVTTAPQVPPEVKADLLDPRGMPDTLLHMRDRPLPPPEQSRRELLKVVEDQITEYEALAKQLRIEVEEPARAAAVEKATMLKGDALALWIRYERMHDSMFHRSYNTLERPETPRPEGDPVVPEEAEESPAPAPASGTETPPEEASTSGAAGSAAATGPSSNDRPCACPDAACTTETESPPVPGAEGPVRADGPDVERQSKRVATVEPVVSASGAVNAGTLRAHEPADGVGFEHGRPDRDEPGDRASPAGAATNRWRGPPMPDDPVGGML
jgi:hypothetical protein